ncbi:MAG: DUF2480 family protein [Bacteroidetes bacterium]|nr:DUF2480 family protein [Bacteroidota bacterium]
MDSIQNKVAQSGIITIDLELLLPSEERILFDIKFLLFQELMLREKDLRDFIKTHQWAQYQNKYVALHCTNDAIVPTWAFMLIALALEPFAKKIVYGTLQELETELLIEAINKMNVEEYKGMRVVIKGCGEKEISKNVYVKISTLLKPHVKSIMYGEPCSTVPLYKNNK